VTIATLGPIRRRNLCWRVTTVSAIKLLQMGTTSGKTIMIIEDEREVVDLLVPNLRKAGFAIPTALDGAPGNVTCVSLNCLE
jgi:hypothetical protein